MVLATTNPKAGVIDLPVAYAGACPLSREQLGAVLEPPHGSWGPGRLQLWDVLEREAQNLGVERAATGPYLWYAPSEGEGAGKVYGGFYGQTTGGAWYSVTVHGPIGSAKVPVKPFQGE